ncbi:MAG: hypothetical protein ACRCZF_12650 [Gemmataceae bacterium]
MPPAEGFSTVVADRPACATGTPEQAARNKNLLFPGEGGPVILEIEVPDSLIQLLLEDLFAAGLAKSGEFRFDPESGLNELRAAWPTLQKRVIPCQ